MKCTRVWYRCNYCETEMNYPRFKYEDRSGLHNNSYDMCSDICRKKHIDYLKIVLPEGEFKQHIKEWLPLKTKNESMV